jgi:hypothetical protein
MYKYVTVLNGFVRKFQNAWSSLQRPSTKKKKRRHAFEKDIILMRGRRCSFNTRELCVFVHGDNKDGCKYFQNEFNCSKKKNK